MAERIAMLGVSPAPEYPLEHAKARDHLRLINKYYTHNIESHRFVLEHFGGLDPITEDLLVAQTRTIEKLQWFLLAHLDSGNDNI